MIENNYCHEKYLIRGEYCESCRQIPWERLIQEAVDAPPTNYDTLYSHAFHTIMVNPKSSVGNPQCPLCCHLWSVIPEIEVLKDRSILVASGRKDIGSETPWYEVCFKASNEAAHSEIESKDTQSDDPNLNLSIPKPWDARFYVSFHHDHKLSSRIVNRVVPTLPLSDTAVNTIKGWLTTCLEDHSRCREALASRPHATLPARLLRVGIPGDTHAYLVETLNGQAFPQYAALSHCWGKEKNFMTTTGTLKARKDGILIQDLPQTFQHAIEVCRKLGLLYLWVDSLCIIQDCLKDWEIESAKMGSVYMGSHVTIAASRAFSDLEGFLQPRELIPDGVSCQFYEPSPGIFLTKWQPEYLAGDIASAPLSKRAWVVQERYLASRTVLFAQCQLFWVCYETITAETGQSSPIVASSIHRVMDDILSTALAEDFQGFKSVPKDNSMQRNAPGPHDSWYRMVCEYTGCAITIPTDRLPALSGLASYAASITGEKYYAGIWEKAVIEGLLWVCKEYVALFNTGGGAAPSWSWASTEGQVFFLPCAKYKSLVTVISITVDHSYKHNHFSQVNSGSLTLSAPLLRVEKCTKRPARQSQSWWDNFDKFLIQFPNQCFYGLGAYFDTDYPVDADLYICALALDYQDGILGLILLRIGTEQYRRVGIVESLLYEGTSFFEDAFIPGRDDLDYPHKEQKDRAYSLLESLPCTEITIV